MSLFIKSETEVGLHIDRSDLTLTLTFTKSQLYN